MPQMSDESIKMLVQIFVKDAVVICLKSCMRPWKKGSLSQNSGCFTVCFELEEGNSALIAHPACWLVSAPVPANREHGIYT